MPTPPLVFRDGGYSLGDTWLKAFQREALPIQMRRVAVTHVVRCYKRVTVKGLGGKMAAFEVPSRQIVSELIDGEAVILDLRSGCYHTTEGVGAAVWQAASQGMHGSAIVASCRARFPDEHGVEHDIETLLKSFVAVGLLAPADGAPDSSAHLPGWPADYQTPTLDSYDNLADMMALDPIHDVDAVGWPSPGVVADRG